jgi:hypothetical protein
LRLADPPGKGNDIAVMLRSGMVGVVTAIHQRQRR